MKDQVSEFINSIRINFNFPIEALTSMEQDSIKEHFQLVKVARKKQLFNEGEDPKGVYIVKKGKLKLLKTHANGAVHIHFILEKEQFFGYDMYLAGTKNLFSAVALEDCELNFLPMDKFMELIDNNPIFAKIMLQEVCRSFTVLLSRTNLYSQKTVPQRLAYALLLLDEKYTTQDNSQLAAPVNLSRKDLASYIGTSIEVLVRILKQFEKSKIVRLEAKYIFIEDFDAMINLAKTNSFE